MMAEEIGTYKDIPTSEVYTDPQTTAWIMGTWSILKGYQCPAVVTGKLVEVGGSKRRDATKHLGMGITNLKVVVQGFGNVGYYSSIKLKEMGAKIIGVSDSKGGIYSAEGLDPEKVAEYKRRTGSVVGYNGLKPITNEALLTSDCDVLVPAAVENQLTEEVAKGVKAEIVVEGANGPTTPAGDRVLIEKGVFLVPDILANSGGCDSQLLQMGPEPSGILLGGGAGEWEAGEEDGEGVQRHDFDRQGVRR